MYSFAVLFLGYPHDAIRLGLVPPIRTFITRVRGKLQHPAEYRPHRQHRRPCSDLQAYSRSIHGVVLSTVGELLPTARASSARFSDDRLQGGTERLALVFNESLELLLVRLLARPYGSNVDQLADVFFDQLIPVVPAFLLSMCGFAPQFEARRLKGRASELPGARLFTEAHGRVVLRSSWVTHSRK
jgi:hypothetical protein